MNNYEPKQRLYAAKWLQSNRMYCSVILPFLNILFEVSVELRDVTIDCTAEKTYFFTQAIDFSRINYCIQTIHNLIKFHPKNVLRTLSSNEAVEAGIKNPFLDQLLPIELRSFLDHVVFISSIYVEGQILEDNQNQLLDNLTLKENACGILATIFQNDNLGISDSIVDFVLYSCTKTLAKQVISEQVYLQLPLAQLLNKIYDQRRVDINNRLESSLSQKDSFLSKGM
jgi:hypothetical protein